VTAPSGGRASPHRPTLLFGQPTEDTDRRFELHRPSAALLGHRTASAYPPRRQRRLASARKEVDRGVLRFPTERIAHPRRLSQHGDKLEHAREFMHVSEWPPVIVHDAVRDRT
jgi:hypothetical protein